MTKNKVLIMLLALVLAISVIGGCFALYKINATDKEIDLNTGDSIALTWLDSADLAETVVNPSTDSKTKTWILKLSTATAVTDASKYGKFSIAIDNGLSSFLDVTASDGKNTYTESQLLNGVYVQLKGLNTTPLTITLTITFSGNNTDWSGDTGWAEKVTTITANWVVDESYTGDWTPVAGWYLVGKINGEESWAVHTDGTTAKYAFTAISDSHDPSYSGTDNRAVLENIELQAGDAVKILRYYEDSGTLKEAWQGDFKGLSGTGAGTLTFDSQGNFVANETGSYSFYVNPSWEIYVVYTAPAQ